MKFLHTSDLHLGRTLYSVPLIEDQKHFLLKIFDELENAQNQGEPYDALLIPGDIYDRAVPSVQAVSVFDDFLSKISDNFKDLHTFIISGNHDGAERLGFASKFLEKSNIHIRFDVKKLAEPVILKETAVYQIPFLTGASFPFLNSKTQQSLYEKAVGEILQNHKKNFPQMQSVVLAHATVFGANFGSGAVGNADSIDKDLFDGFAYTALGHIHKAQKVSGRTVYCGSPLAYSFDDDSKKIMISGKISADGNLEISEIPIEPLHKVVRLYGTFDEFYEKSDEEAAKFENAFLEIRCTDSEFHAQPKQILQKKYPLLLSFARESVQKDDETQKKIARRKEFSQNGDEISLLKEFLKENSENSDSEIFGEEIALFESIIGEIKDENGGEN